MSCIASHSASTSCIKDEHNKDKAGFFEEKGITIELINELLVTSDDAFEGSYPLLEKYLIKYQGI